jgi:hypothetical protein
MVAPIFVWNETDFIERLSVFPNFIKMESLIILSCIEMGCDLCCRLTNYESEVIPMGIRFSVAPDFNMQFFQ